MQTGEKSLGLRSATFFFNLSEKDECLMPVQGFINCLKLLRPWFFFSLFFRSQETEAEQRWSGGGASSYLFTTLAPDFTSFH